MNDSTPFCRRNVADVDRRIAATKPGTTLSSIAATQAFMALA
jgi:hypothetical protein